MSARDYGTTALTGELTGAGTVIDRPATSQPPDFTDSPVWRPSCHYWPAVADEASDRQGDSMELKRAACLHADVSGYCRLINRDVESTVKTLTAYRKVMAAAVARHGGRVVDTAGDSLLAEFSSAAAALRCGIDIQREVEAQNADLPAGRRLRFRVGIDLGDVLVVEDGRIYGNCVNIAARMQEVAAPGSICVAGTAYDHIERAASPSGFEYLGERFVKNIDASQRVYRVG